MDTRDGLPVVDGNASIGRVPDELRWSNWQSMGSDLADSLARWRTKGWLIKNLQYIPYNINGDLYEYHLSYPFVSSAINGESGPPWAGSGVSEGGPGGGHETRSRCVQRRETATTYMPEKMW